VRVEVRRAEPEDYKAVHFVNSSPNTMAETLGVPSSSGREWREKLSDSRNDITHLVACVREEVVGTELMEATLDLVDNWLGLTRLDLRVYVDAHVMARLK
jgi:putative acetyltransferase